MNCVVWSNPDHDCGQMAKGSVVMSRSSSKLKEVTIKSTGKVSYICLVHQFCVQTSYLDPHRLWCPHFWCFINQHLRSKNSDDAEEEAFVAVQHWTGTSSSVSIFGNWRPWWPWTVKRLAGFHGTWLDSIWIYWDVCMYTFTSVHYNIFAIIYTCIHMYVHTHVYIYIYTCTYVYVYIYIYMFVPDPNYVGMSGIS